MRHVLVNVAHLPPAGPHLWNGTSYHFRSTSWEGPMSRILHQISLAILIFGPFSLGQEIGPIEGNVVDAKGIAIPAAIVRLSSKEPGPPLETLTETDGTFAFSNLPPGSYQITVEMAGFQKLTLEGVGPSTEESRRLKLVLKRPEAPRSPSAEVSERRPPR